MSTEKPGLHLSVYRFRGQWHALIDIHWSGWTDQMSAVRGNWIDALDWGLRVMRRLAE